MTQSMMDMSGTSFGKKCERVQRGGGGVDGKRASKYGAGASSRAAAASSVESPSSHVSLMAESFGWQLSRAKLGLKPRVEDHGAQKVRGLVKIVAQHGPKRPNIPRVAGTRAGAPGRGAASGERHRKFARVLCAPMKGVPEAKAPRVA